MNPRIEIEPGPASWPQVRALLAEVWPNATPAPWGHVTWAQGPARRIIVRDEARELACHVGLHLRDAVWDGRPVRIGGVGGVVTRAQQRRHGIATAAMKRAAREIEEVDKADFALLFCEPHNFPFYTRLGWRRFEDDVLVEQPHGRVRFEVMAAFVLDLRLQPRTGAIDLCGPPW
jgi:aminoglycoside 2'-N-acetyltransferase I